jgi:glycosyltransferase involved in cell wall biosynthesis
VALTTWQRWQLWMLGRSADVLFFSIEAWTQRFRRWFPSKPVWHLPVGSNIPRTRTGHAAARARLGIPEDTLLLGLFGTAHLSRLLGWVRAAAERVERSGREALVLYIGPHPSLIQAQLPGIAILAGGPLPAVEVSQRFAALDICLAPFVDGISTRRTSLMTALQHGIATVGTRGRLTDTVFLQENGRAFLLARADRPEEFAAHVLYLAEDRSCREKLGQEAEKLYEREFAWSQIVARLLAILGGCC